MYQNRIKEIKDKNTLIEIQNEIKNACDFRLLGAYKKNEIEKKYLEALNKINKIDFPVLSTRDFYYKKEEYIEYIYDFLRIDVDSYRWLIPYYKDSNWWIELEIVDLIEFIDIYFPNCALNDLMVIDINNDLLIDISNGERNYEYRIIRV